MSEEDFIRAAAPDKIAYDQLIRAISPNLNTGNISACIRYCEQFAHHHSFCMAQMVPFNQNVSSNPPLDNPSLGGGTVIRHHHTIRMDARTIGNGDA